MKKDLSFSKSLARLEEIVAKLESQTLDIDEAVNLLSEGIKLHKYCQTKLFVSQQRINSLARSDNLEV